MPRVILPNERVLNCGKCKKNFIQKWVSSKKEWSKLNEVDYWTDGKRWKGIEYICRSCLKDWFINHREEFKKLVESKKRRLVSSYHGHGTLDKEDKI